MKVTGFCRLVREPELKYTDKGTALCKCAVVWNKKEESHFIDVVAWSEVAESLSVFHKGDFFLVEGVLKQDRWQDKETGQNRSKYTITITSFERYKAYDSEIKDEKSDDFKEDIF